MAIRALIVDDVADARRLVRFALKVRGGFDVVAEAADGESAVAAAREHRPDVIVLDLGLPDLAGREVVTRLRQEAPDAGIVVFTGLDVADDEFAGRVAGVVRKDTDVQVLADLLVSVTAPAAETRKASLAVPAEATGVSAARHFLRDHATAWGHEDVLDEAMLVVSELVTNAMTHAGTACTLRLRSTPSFLRIEVVDGGRGSPDLHLASSDDEHGRGLLLVAAMSVAWGVEAATGGGKVVWAELACQPAEARPR